MDFAEYCYGPLEDIYQSLSGDNPPDDPKILRAVLARCVEEIITIQAQRANGGGA